MFLMIDNYDSFVYNLKAYFEELGEDILVRRSDEITLEEIEEMRPEGLIISPGPKRPWDAALSVEAVKRLAGRIPILGVCLGHQIIGHVAGAAVEKGMRPMHGKVTEIRNFGQGLFKGLPETFSVTRYHSLIVREDTLPEEYRVDAVAEDGAVMAISHRELPVFGVQFHPEAVLTEYGHELLANFCKCAKEFGKKSDSGEEQRRVSGRTVRELTKYIPLSQIFGLFEQYKDTAFLDSSLENDLGQYSILGLSPYLKLVKSDGEFTVNGQPSEESFEEYVKRYLREHRDENETELPMVSGAIGYFSYDYGREKEGIKSKDEKNVEIPDAVLIFYDILIVEDLKRKKIWMAANGMTGDSAEKLCELEEKITKAFWKETKKQELPMEPGVFPNFEKEEYKRAVDHMISYIVEGDIYIANMTQHLTVQSLRRPEEVFRKLRKDNPSPFGGYFNYGDFQIISASPERFLRMKNGHVTTRPIKGTRRRGDTPEEDAALREELQNSGKDQSELLMIVDLERNDLNRVCIPGSVKVTELFAVEEYATVFHLVSNVEGDLKPDKTVMDLIQAAFPGGSITGAPKYRAMEIIDELEHGRRNLYTGSMGYLTLDGGCDFNIVIRTALYKDGTYYLGVGGGITAESDLEFEYEETLQKAKAILEALR